jgi:hypothetical protein
MLHRGVLYEGHPDCRLLVPKNLTARVPEILAGFRNERKIES